MNSRIQPDQKIHVAGHRGVIGSALVRALGANGYNNIVTRARGALDLTDQAATRAFFQAERPEFVFLAAAKSGGVLAHSVDRAEFIYQNLMVQCNVVRAAFEAGVRNLVFIASNSIYPRSAPQPLKEGSLLTGSLDSGSEPDAVAKIAGLKMCSAFNRQYDTNYITVVPAKAYGPGDSFNPYKSHVLPALIRRLSDAKKRNVREVVVWGNGNSLREFIYSDDLAEACVFLMERGDVNRIGELINVGSGSEITIKELAQTIARIVGFEGRLVFDSDKADDVPKKRLDSTRITGLGWTAKTNLYDGVTSTYSDFLSRVDEINEGSGS